MTRQRWGVVCAAALLLGGFPRQADALDPHKMLTQYSRTVWTQEHGLPQDTIRSIAQTTDGYLWLGTDEGLARFDGYEFTVFNKANGDLPSNSITTLAAAGDGSLWIGTSNGLTQYRDKRFRTYTAKQGLPETAITFLYTDHADTLWIVAGVNLCRFSNGVFTTFVPGKDIPVTSVRTVTEDKYHHLWVAGFTGVVELLDGKFVRKVDSTTLNGDVVNWLKSDRQDNLWVAGSLGLIEQSPSGRIRQFTDRDGLPDAVVRSVAQDHDGNIWAATNGGLARLEGDRFVASTAEGGEGDLVRCLLEDREGDLWVGANNGLIRLRDDVFTAYGKSEGLPGDEPNTVFQDRRGRIWVGFNDEGLALLSKNGNRRYTTRDGMPDNNVFTIREDRAGDLLLATRGGLVTMEGSQFRTLVPPDPLGRRVVLDAIEDSTGGTWLASPGGLFELRGADLRSVVPGGPLFLSAVVVLCEGRDGAIWAGTYGKGLWRIQGEAARLFTTADGLSSNQIRALNEDSDGTLWIGTFGGGLDALRGGHFESFTGKDGLLSDNIVHIEDDGDSLWLSTTRGICRIPRRQLSDFAAHKRAFLDPMNYGVEDGLRSAQCSPGYPIGGGGRTRDGRLWFTTSRGLAVFDPSAQKRVEPAPAVHLVEVTAGGERIDISRAAKLEPDRSRLQIRYTGIHLSAPERVRYSYRLQGLDNEWVQAGSRRLINYNSLRHGSYIFTVRAELPGGPASEASYAFEMLPFFYETWWFRLLCAGLVAAAVWGGYQMRLRQIRYRFVLVLEERARLAREIHDTLAQGFVGISSQLDAVALSMPADETPARKYLDMARRMARHSLTEARRSVLDLRASVLVGQDLAAALETGTRLWSAGSGVEVAVDVSGPRPTLPQDVEQHLLRIAQEAVTNAVKHSGARRVWIKLHTEARRLYLRVVDDGRGFEPKDVFSSSGGHFGLIGMRERAERLGGQLKLASQPGGGTEVEVMVPLR